MTHLLIPATVALGLVASLCGGAFPAPRRIRWMAACTAGSAGFALAASASVLRSGNPIRVNLSQLVPATGASLTLDRLGALFTAVIAVVAICAAVFAAGYRGHGMSSRTACATFPMFVTSMLLVPAASSVTTFLYLWELMAITSLFLVLVDHRHRSTVHSAGQWYAVMTQVGAGAILIGLVLFATHVGGQEFETIRQHAHTLSSPVSSAAFVLTVVGFGSKAGAVPLHVWLPRAHAAAQVVAL